MIDKDSRNPFLNDEHSPETVSGALCSLITSVSLTVTVDPQLSTAFITNALGSLVALVEEGDASAALRALLFEVTRYVHIHVAPDVPVIESERSAEHEAILAGDPRLRVLTTAANEWFKLTCAQRDEPAGNVLKAIHKEVPLLQVPSALLYIATVAVCSLGVSVHMQYLADPNEDEGGQHTHL
jgi:hypothetical protein